MSNKMNNMGYDKEISGVQDKLNQQERVNIKIPVIPGADDQVEVCINGFWMAIKRGVSVDIPLSVKAVLEQAEII